MPVITEHQDGIGFLKLDHPQKRNALSAALIDDLLAGMDTLSTAKVRALILSAAGDLLLASARETFRRQLTGRGYRPEARIVAARLGNDAGLIGAADLARYPPEPRSD